jgi:small conductance mechanosensitive channel
VVVPNRKIVGEILHNYGRIRQLDVTVGVAYDSDLGASLAVIQAILTANPRVLKDPPPVIQPIQLADSSVNIAVRPWALTQDRGAVTGEIYGAILESFRARGIVIPFPQREVRLVGQAQPSPAS